MSGAQLEAAGQVRNNYRIVSRHFAATVVWTSAAHTLAELSIDRNTNLPFDKGPDKSGRVFLALNGGSVILTADVLGAGVILDGFLYYQMPNGLKVYLTAIRQSLATNAALNIDIYAFPEYSLNADSVSNIGAIGFENNASALGGATNISIITRLNVGFYGDYAEPDFRTMFDGLKNHEHIGFVQQANYLDDPETRQL